MTERQIRLLFNEAEQMAAERHSAQIREQM